MINLENVTKQFQRGPNVVTALKGINLSINDGEFISIMGPSGCGKSTMLHIMGGMDTPTTGRIIFDGKNISEISDDALSLIRRRQIGFVFQFFNLIPTLSASENVALPLMLDGRSFSSTRDRVDELLELVGLAGRGNHLPSELSGGEMQRVAIARALVNRPSLILADEPTGNLDSVTGQSVLNLLKSFQDQLGQTIVMVTHDARAAAYGDRIVTLKDGLIQDHNWGGNNHAANVPVS
ncbi:MAG: ABC transporter ATP-binding protein [Bacillota bacterium]